MFGKFDIRSNAVRTCVRVVFARPSRRRRVLRGALRRRRAYKPGLGGIARPDRLAARRRRYMHWIKTWAATTHGPYTVASYQRRRLASAPAAPHAEHSRRRVRRLAQGAFRSGGIDGRLPIRAGNRTRSADERRRAARAARRRDVLAAVERCCRELGRSPRVSEFLRWRSRGVAGVPSPPPLSRRLAGGPRRVISRLGGAPRAAGAVGPRPVGGR
jgi:hypothetical protein